MLIFQEFHLSGRFLDGSEEIKINQTDREPKRSLHKDFHPLKKLEKTAKTAKLK